MTTLDTTLCPLCSMDNLMSAVYCGACGASLRVGSQNGGTSLVQDDSDTTDALPAGTTLANGAYVVDQVLGQGGFGITYLSHDARLRRTVAIKEFFPFGCLRQNATVQPSRALAPANYKSARTKFQQEARTLARLKHPGIVDVYTVFEENNTAYMVMEFLEGKSLAALMQEAEGRLPEDDAVRFIERVGDALQSVHEVGLLHRDIKPENIIVCNDGRVMLIDFGTAKEYSANTTQGHTVAVTPGYAPLEQYAQRAQRGAYTDVYGLAATLYHLLTGEIPTAASDRAMGVELRPVRELNPQVSHSVARAVEAGLQVEINKRPQSVREFLDVLHGSAHAGGDGDSIDVFGNLTLSPSLPPLPTAPPVPPPTSNQFPRWLSPAPDMKSFGGLMLTLFALSFVPSVLSFLFVVRSLLPSVLPWMLIPILYMLAIHVQKVLNSPIPEALPQKSRKRQRFDTFRLSLNPIVSTKPLILRFGSLSLHEATDGYSLSLRKDFNGCFWAIVLAIITLQSVGSLAIVIMLGIKFGWLSLHKVADGCSLSLRKAFSGYLCAIVLAIITFQSVGSLATGLNNRSSTNEPTIETNGKIYRYSEAPADVRARVEEAEIRLGIEEADRSRQRAKRAREKVEGSKVEQAPPTMRPFNPQPDTTSRPKSSQGTGTAVFSPDGKVVARAGLDNAVRLWSVPNGRLLYALKEHKRSVDAIAFSPDGTRLATASQDRRVQVWNLRTGKPTRSWHTASPRCRVLAFSPDGNLLAGVDNRTQDVVTLWNMQTGQRREMKRGSPSPINAITFSSDGRSFVASDGSRAIRWYDVQTGRPKGSIVSTLPESPR